MEGTVSVITSDPLYKNGNDRFTTGNIYLINNVEDIIIFLGLKVVITDNFFTKSCHFFGLSTANHCNTHRKLS